MQINFKDTSLDLSNGTALMGIIELDPREPLDIVSVQNQTRDFLECGAIGIELGIKKFSGLQSAVVPVDQSKLSNMAASAQSVQSAQPSQVDQSEQSAQFELQEASPCPCANDPITLAYNALSADQRADILSQATEAVLEVDGSTLVAIYTSEALVMAKTIAVGAQLIIDPMALREPGALETISRLKANVCLCFDQCYTFDEDDNVDVCGKISEFFYERLDACINAKIARSKIMLDPTLSQTVGVDYRIKMQGRIKSFNSFALPLCCELPRVFPVSDEFLRTNMSVTVAVALFVAQQGFQIIRTKNVYDLGLALDTWQALTFSARPFKMRRLIGRKLKALSKKKTK